MCPVSEMRPTDEIPEGIPVVGVTEFRRQGVQGVVEPGCVGLLVMSLLVNVGFVAHATGWGRSGVAVADAAAECRAEFAAVSRSRPADSAGGVFRYVASREWFSLYPMDEAWAVMDERQWTTADGRTRKGVHREQSWRSDAWFAFDPLPPIRLSGNADPLVVRAEISARNPAPDDLMSLTRRVVNVFREQTPQPAVRAALWAMLCDAGMRYDGHRVDRAGRVGMALAGTDREYLIRLIVDPDGGRLLGAEYVVPDLPIVWLAYTIDEAWPTSKILDPSPYVRRETETA